MHACHVKGKCRASSDLYRLAVRIAFQHVKRMTLQLQESWQDFEADKRCPS